MGFDSSSRRDMPSPKTFPVVYRPGYIPTTLTKLASNPANIPSACWVLIGEVSDAVADDVISARFSVAIVTVGETPGVDDYVARKVPIMGNEMLQWPATKLLLPANGELWMISTVASRLTAYIMVDEWQ